VGLLGGVAWWSIAGLPAMASSDGNWPSLQGGPDHPGRAPEGAPGPPLKSTWHVLLPPGTPLSGAVVIPGLAVANAPSEVVGFDPATGRVLWQVGRATGPLDPPAIDPSAGSHGVVVFTEGNDAGDSGIVGIDPSDQHELWRVPLGKASRGAPSILEGTVFVGARDHFLYAIDDESGRVVWKRRTSGDVDASPAVGGGRVFAAAVDKRSGATRLYAIDARTGRVEWTFAPRGGGASSPAFAGDRVYAGFGDGLIRAFDTASGRVVWSALARSAFDPREAPAVGGGSVYLADAAGGLYRLDARTGSRAWEFRFAGFALASSPLIVGRVVYLGLNDGTLGAVDVATGHLVWRTALSSGPIGPIAPSGDALLVPMLGPGGGLAAFEHSPGPLVDVVSPTKLHLGEAMLNFAVAGVAMLFLIYAPFEYLRRRGGGVTREMSTT
jgi:outer membrane protein assembly factor BamB